MNLKRIVNVGMALGFSACGYPEITAKRDLNNDGIEDVKIIKGASSIVKLGRPDGSYQVLVGNLSSDDYHDIDSDTSYYFNHEGKFLYLEK